MKHNLKRLYVLGFALIFPLNLAFSKPRKGPVLPKRAWKKELHQACKIPLPSLSQARPYLLHNAGQTVGIVLGKSWKSKSRHISSFYALTYRDSAKGWQVGRCIKLLEERCAPNKKPRCEHQVRASQLIDLQANQTTVRPENGSWFGSRVIEPKAKASWPLLFVQSKTLRGSSDKRRSRTQTILLSLRTQTPRPLMKLTTRKRWPPILIVGRKQEPIGRRIQELKFSYSPQQPIQLHTIQIPIPSPFDKCCKPKKTFKQYHLSSQGFSEVQSL